MSPADVGLYFIMKVELLDKITKDTGEVTWALHLGKCGKVEMKAVVVNNELQLTSCIPESDYVKCSKYLDAHNTSSYRLKWLAGAGETRVTVTLLKSQTEEKYALTATVYTSTDDGIPEEYITVLLDTLNN